MHFNDQFVPLFHVCFMIAGEVYFTVLQNHFLIVYFNSIFCVSFFKVFSLLCLSNV